MIASNHSEVFERIARESEPDLIGDESVEFSALQMLAELRAGTREAQKLNRAERRAIVEYLTAEGQSVSEMALLLKVNDRTIQRDRHYIRSRNGVFHDSPGFVPRLAGDLMTVLESSVTRIRRACRKPNVKASEVIAAERAVVDITVKVTRALQSLGYVPNIKPQEHDNYTMPPDGRLEPPPRSKSPARKYVMEQVECSMAEMRDYHKPATPKSEWLARFGTGLGFMADARERMEEAKKEAAAASREAFARETYELMKELDEIEKEEAWFNQAMATEESREQMLKRGEVYREELEQQFGKGKAEAQAKPDANAGPAPATSTAKPANATAQPTSAASQSVNAKPPPAPEVPPAPDAPPTSRLPDHGASGVPPKPGGEDGVGSQ